MKKYKTNTGIRQCQKQRTEVIGDFCTAFIPAVEIAVVAETVVDLAVANVVVATVLVVGVPTVLVVGDELQWSPTSSL